MVAYSEELRFRVGVSLPLSGPLAEYGVAVQNGIEMARSENPSAFRRLDFVYQDNAYDAKKAVSSFQRLVDVDHVDEIMVWGNEPALSVAPIAEQRKTPLIAIAQYAQASAGKEYVIRFLNSGQQYSDALLAYLRQQQVKNILVVQSELSFFNMLVDGLQAGLKDEKVEVIQRFLPAETDFRSLIVKLKTRRFDILGVYLVAPQIPQFFKQAAELNFQPRTFGASPFESKSVIADAWRLMNGAVFTHNGVVQEFRDKYTESFKNDMQLAYAANAYDFANLTAKLFGKLEQKLTADQVLAAYSSVKLTCGASGPFHFADSPEDGKHFVFDIVVKKIEGQGTSEVYRARLGAQS